MVVEGLWISSAKSPIHRFKPRQTPVSGLAPVFQHRSWEQPGQGAKSRSLPATGQGQPSQAASGRASFRTTPEEALALFQSDLTSCHLSDFSVNPCGSRGSLDLFCKESNTSIQTASDACFRTGTRVSGPLLGPAPSPDPCQRPVKGNRPKGSFGTASFRRGLGLVSRTTPGPTRSDLGANRPKR